MNAVSEAVAIEVDGLHKVYREHGVPRSILTALALQVGVGEFVCVVGRSGGGKTTLLNILGGLDRDFEGRVAVAGANLADLDDNRLSAFRNHSVGLVFQEARLVTGLSCRDNLMLPSLFSRGSSRRPAGMLRRRADELLEAVGLAGRAAARAGELSGGEKQRLSLARAILNEPRVLLCDEITGNLDAHTGKDMIDLVLRMRNELELTIVAAAHDPSFTRAADRVLVLDGGRLAPWAGEG